jgi:hypothetical protein
MNGYPLLIRSTTISRCLLVSEGRAKSRRSSYSEREAGRDNQMNYTDGTSHEMQHSSVAAATINNSLYQPEAA